MKCDLSQDYTNLDDHLQTSILLLRMACVLMFRLQSCITTYVGWWWESSAQHFLIPHSCPGIFMCILKIVFGIYTHCQQIDCFLKYSKVNIHFKTQPGPVAKTRLGLKIMCIFLTQGIYLTLKNNLSIFMSVCGHYIIVNLLNY